MSRLLVLAGLFASALVSPASPVGKYPPVTSGEVPQLKLHHYHPDRGQMGRPADFEWTFTKDGFTLRKRMGPIPEDLRKKLLPDGASADEITGTWAIVKGPRGEQEIVFTGIRAGDRPGREKATYHIYKTAPTVVRIGEPQYVFSLVRK
jgi:hypothetical protein